MISASTSQLSEQASLIGDGVGYRYLSHILPISLPSFASRRLRRSRFGFARADFAGAADFVPELKGAISNLSLIFQQDEKTL